MFSSLLLAVTIVAHDPGYNTALANHLGRWMKNEAIAAKVVTPREMAAELKREKLAFLVGFGTPSDSEMKTLREFRARGGKLVVFHSANPALARLMGVKPLGYLAAPYPGAYSKMNFDASSFSGCPTTILQTSGVLNRVAPEKGRGRVIANWLDREGRTTGEAAWVQTDAGWWMSHVLLADGDEDLKSRLVAAICGAVDPALWNYAKYQARDKARREELKAFAKKQTPSAGEIHATWDHSGCGLYPGDWPKTIRVLREARVTDLFVNVAGAGFAHYPSSVLPRSRVFADEGDQLAACLEAARGTGVRVHAWLLTFSAARAAPSVLENYAKRGWRLKDAQGRLTDYVDPADSAVRKLLLDAIDELQRRYPGLAGIHLDFIRYGESAVKPADAAERITSFVTQARARVKSPRWFTTAVYGSHPRCVGTVGQDWPGWLDAKIVDYVVPMDYTEKDEDFLELLGQQGGSRSRAKRTIIGIGVTANESRLDAKDVIRQIKLTRRYGFAGVSLFDLDTTLEKNILPYLMLGLW